jgi:tRNAThr (cytosine32-N3)-methyltransferase
MDDLEVEETRTMALPVRTKQPRQQLTKGMEHMRSYVTISDQDSAPPSSGDVGEDAYGVPASYEPIRKQNSEQAATNPQKRSDPFQFGTRYLAEGDDIFAFNAWDHVEVDPQYSDFITQQTDFQRQNQVSDFDKHRFNSQPEKWWDKFYSNNATNFFKDRKWLVQEFPILGEVTRAEYGPVTVLEVGAGAGNTALPLLAMNRNGELRLHACDYSKKAVDLIRGQNAYSSQPEPAVLRADVWDAASTSLPPSLESGSVDLVLMIFIFSALSPEQWTQAVKNVWEVLKPGGEVLFRDYGRGDLAQVRFKKGRYLEENFYVRGDGTRVYFFEQEELRQIWAGVSDSAIEQEGLVSHESSKGRQADNQTERVVNGASGCETETNNQVESDVHATSGSDQGEIESPVPVHNGHQEAKFEVLDLATDRRMLVNRQRKLKMYRCWLQGRFRKPGATVDVKPGSSQSSSKSG